MSRDRMPRRRRDLPQPPQPEPEIAETRKPLYRLRLSDSVRNVLNANVAVDIEVCTTGEACARAAHCGNQAHVKVIAQAWCADHWIAIRELYDAMSGGRLNYGPGALNLIAMKRTSNFDDAEREARLPDEDEVQRSVDTNTASPARMYDFYLGGKHNYPTDREAARKALSAVPQGREIARTNRRFLVQAVKHLAHNGIDQYIDIGTGIPTSPNVHEVARDVIPNARVVYVDNDPDVVMQNRAILADFDSGVRAIYGDIRFPLSIANDRALNEVIDFGRPVGVLFVAVLHFLTNGDDPYNSVSVFTHRIASGSYIAISHITNDGTRSEAMTAISQAYARASAPAVFRTKKEIEVFFNGLELVTPGLVEVSQWPNGERPEAYSSLRLFAGVGRKYEQLTPSNR